MYGISRFRAALVCLTVGCGAWFSGCSPSAPAAPQLPTVNVGERISAGRITYTVFETQWMTHLGEGMDARVPQNRFLLVRMNIVNGGSSEATIPNFTIVDDSGTSYEELSNGDGVPQWIGYLRSVRSTDYLEGNVVFDAPPAHYTLHLADDAGTHKILVELPLNFNAEAPADLTLPPNLSRPPASPNQK